MLLTRSPLHLPRCCHRLGAVRLACVRHAASVRPEPGSNSPSRSLGPEAGRSDETKSRRRSWLLVGRLAPESDGLSVGALLLIDVAASPKRRRDRPHSLFRPLFRFQGATRHAPRTRWWCRSAWPGVAGSPAPSRIDGRALGSDPSPEAADHSIRSCRVVNPPNPSSRVTGLASGS